MLNEKQSFACYVIGEESLTIQCAEVLLKKGHRLLAIISSNLVIKEWADKNRVSYIDVNSNFEKIILASKFDYLFSIVNPHILSQKIIKKPRCLAINYHDSLLPKYAGVHATSWAIINRESKHGISWHVMSDIIDGGDLLKQAVVRIDPDETALTLNLKCYKVAIEAFKKLIKELSTKTYLRVPQDLTKRTYYSGTKKPPEDGLLNWHDSGESIESLSRALHFGDYPNRLGTLKLKIGNQFYYIDQVKLAKNKSRFQPGTIAKITRKELKITTNSKDIIISDFKTWDNKLCDVRKLSNRHKLKVGSRLLAPNKKKSNRFREIAESICKHELFWVNELRKAKPVTLPFLNFETNKDNYKNSQFFSYKISSKLKKQLRVAFPSLANDHKSFILTTLLIYFYRISSQENVSVEIAFPELKEEVSLVSPLMASCVPLTIDLNDNLAFKKALEIIEGKLSYIKIQATYQKDICIRYPDVKKNSRPFPIGIRIEEKLPHTKKLNSSQPITFIITNESISLYVDKSYLNANFKNALSYVLGHFQTLLKGISAHPNEKISLLPLLTAEEMKTILGAWNRTQAAYPIDKSISQLFEEQVEKTPDNVAVVFGNRQATYRELNEKANQLARYLLKNGLKNNDCVPLCLERSLEMIIGVLGIIKSGGIYVPISPNFPVERIKFIIKDTKADFIITQSKCLNKIKNKKLFIINFDIDYSVLIKESKLNLAVPNIMNNFIYILYTSGTTGNPKGVIIKHKSVVNLAAFQVRKFTITPNDTVLNFASLEFDASIWEIIPALLGGAKLLLANKKDLLSGQVLSDFLKRNKVTIVTLPPSVLAITPVPRSNWLRIVISAGEICPAAVFEKWKKNRIFINAYGPTEATVCATLDFNRSLSIGSPISNVRVFILDKNDQLLPVGIPGELCIEGDGLAEGYLNLPRATKEKFIYISFDKKSALRLYKTGDIARWLPSGNLEYIGRNDGQIKICGFRIELNEIKSILEKYPKVLQVVPFVRKVNNYNQLEVFFVIKKNKNIGDKFNAESLKRYLKKKLPEYMVPSKISEVDKIPLTSNGKIDFGALLSLSSYSYNRAIKEKRDVESILKHIWEKVLHIKRISLTDNFFSLGGDSICAISIIAEANKYGLRVKIQDIFQYPTILALTKNIKKYSPISYTPIKDNIKFSLSPIQRWFFSNEFNKKEIFSQMCLLTINNSEDIKKLQQHLARLFSKEDSFRLRFSRAHQHWQQFYEKKSPNYKQAIEVMDASSYSIEKLDKVIEHHTYQLQAGFNLREGPLFKAAIFTHTASTKLLLVCHHLIMDGVSWRIFLTKLQQSYGTFSSIEQSKQPIQSNSYHNWITSLEKYANSKALKAEKLYWDKIHNSEFTIPIDYQKGNNNEQSVSSVTLVLTEEETTRLLQIMPSLYKLKFHEVLIALLAKTLSMWTKATEIRFDLESHGRNELDKTTDFSQTIGWFTSIYPALFSIDTAMPLLDIINKVKDQLEIIPHNGIGYGILHFQKNAIHLSSSQVVFNYWGQFDTSINDKLFVLDEIKLVSDPLNNRSYLINVDAVVKHNKLHLSWFYSKNFHTQHTIEQLAFNYLTDLKSLLRADHSLQPSLNSKSEPYLASDQSIRNIYSLTPLQKGLLFHATMAPDAEAYMVQLVMRVGQKTNLDLNYFRQAWQVLLDRHDILRTGFIWEGVTEPQQIVKAKVVLPYYYYVWPDSAEKEQQQERLAAFLKADRQAGFNLKEAPLLRLTVIALPKQEHIIVTTFHHILLDGWSISILLDEFSLIYKSLVKQASLNLSDPQPYIKYIHWLEKQDLDLAEKFWKRYLKDFSAPTDLAIINRHLGIAPNEDNIEFDTELWQIPLQLQNQIKRYCAKFHITSNTLFQGVWALLLNRYSQSNDIVFGVTLSGRSPKLENSDKMVGLLINTLPLRITLKEDVSVKRFLSDIQLNASYLSDYVHTPLTVVKKSSDVPGDVELFNSIFIFENYPVSESRNNLFQLKNTEIIDPTHYPLTFVVIPGERFTVKVVYNKRIIYRNAINFLINHVKTLLCEVITYPEKSIHALNMLTTTEYHNIITDWNKTEANFSLKKAVHQLFEEQAEKSSNDVAVAFEDESLTYRELNEKSNQLAHYLINQGVKKGDFVAIYIERNMEMIIAILAILKAGGAYIPLDPYYPPKRIEYLLQDSHPAALLAQKNIWDKLSFELKFQTKLVFIDKNIFSENFSTRNPNVRISLKNPIYVIYTSGSTGNPKGVIITHENILNFLYAIRLKINIDKSDILLAITSIGFDISGLEMYLPLIVGAKCIIADYETTKDGRKLKEAIENHHVTFLQATPMTWKMLIEAGWQGSSKINALCGGEYLGYQLAKQLSKRVNSFWNLYGPTETTIWSTLYHVTSLAKNKAIIPIGKALANTKVYVLNSHKKPVPVGIIGELYIAGKGVAQGYLNKSQMTQARFIKNPFSKKYSILYKTGDLVRWLPTGDLEYIARDDDQIKINSFRIELGEIEAHLEAHPDIFQAKVICNKQSNGEKQLVAYFISKNKEEYSNNNLRNFLIEFVPYYMVPSHFIRLEKFPLTPNGKIDKSKLPFSLCNKINFKEHVISDSEDEVRLGEIWKKVLNVSQIEVEDNFFDLGGNSLLALQLLSKIYKNFKVDLPVRAIFDSPTVRQLINTIRLISSENKALLAAVNDKKNNLEKCLIPLQPHGNKIPLFLIHPVGGTVFWYISLAKYLDADRPLYGIQDVGIKENEIPFKSIQEMAAFYIEMIKKIQPHGPYLLGGASAGANISIEMAYQLQLKGDTVLFIGLLDGWAFYPDVLKNREFFEMAMRHQYNVMQNKFLAKGIDQAEKLLALQWQRSQLNHSYCPPVIRNKLTLFKAAEILDLFASIDAPFNHWERYSSEPIEVNIIPGNHETMFQEPHVAYLGKKLNDYLNRVDTSNIIYESTQNVMGK